MRNRCSRDFVDELAQLRHRIRLKQGESKAEGIASVAVKVAKRGKCLVAHAIASEAASLAAVKGLPPLKMGGSSHMDRPLAGYCRRRRKRRRG